jgi:hypothetical protein
MGTESTSGKLADRIREYNLEHTKFDGPTVSKIIHAFSLGGTITQCAEFAGITRQTLHNWLKKDLNFAEQCHSARAHFALTEVNPELKKRDPYKYLKALYPEDFRDTVELTGKGGEALTLTIKDYRGVLDSPPPLEVEAVDCTDTSEQKEEE